MADEHDMTERRFREMIARALDEERPDRYVVSDSTEDRDDLQIPSEETPDVDWINEVADRFADQIPDSVARKLHARTIAKRVESTNLRRGNRKIRELYESDQLELGWLETANYPVAVVHRITQEGEPTRKRIERVRVAAMTSNDLRIFAQEERRNAARDFATRNETCDAAESIAEEMDRRGHETVRDWGDDRSSGGEVAVS